MTAPALAAAVREAEEALAYIRGDHVTWEDAEDRLCRALTGMLSAVKQPAPAIPSNLRPSIEEFRVASEAWGDCHCEEEHCDHMTRMRIASAEIAYTVLDWLDGKADYHAPSPDNCGALRRCGTEGGH